MPIVSLSWKTTSTTLPKLRTAIYSVAEADCSCRRWIGLRLRRGKTLDSSLEAVLRGIDAAFDRYDQRPSKAKKVNSLAYCSQEVLAAAEEMKEAAVGAADTPFPDKSKAPGFGPEAVSSFLLRNAELLVATKLPQMGGAPVLTSDFRNNQDPSTASCRYEEQSSDKPRGS